MTTAITAASAMKAAEKAQDMLDTHEKLCAERYGRIDDGLNVVRGDVSDVRTDMKDLTGRINLMLIGIGGCLFTVIMALVFKH